ncbi:MAG: DUF3842 family protein [Firmicutes bacterium]|nr:DUF3842 family protein [Bacillota bacterium]
MNILIIDAQGGGIGKQVVTAIKREIPQIEITAVGTNSTATAAMLKAGADHAATGENAVVVGCRKADVIVGPIGIVIADAMFGEVTPVMALAVGQSNAKRLLIPVNHCDNFIVGISDLSVGRLIDEVLKEIKEIMEHTAK